MTNPEERPPEPVERPIDLQDVPESERPEPPRDPEPEVPEPPD
ncbi:hypothetical protein ACWT_3113 [Actinoplanes sp. SE50]|nr:MULTISPECIES: hypothetical protein [unclassified Actinoplanes]AEV84136.1 hypothetical protein ACPL_3241 [Actinoplanes sp. SE50/110]ATO82528.1 hypothetical protein ACWT_3113 [Actinoplanes sp. SE50]SLL99935.1 hypothetical protein ACSP50_3167 [Actinoplanes sp. SE50/110]